MTPPAGCLLFCGDPEASPAAWGAAAHVAASHTLAVDAWRDVDAAAVMLAAPGRPVVHLAVLAVGPGTHTTALRRLARVLVDRPCLVVCGRDDVAQWQRVLAFLSPTAGGWRLARADEPDLAARMRDTMDASLRGRRLRTTLDRMNLRLGSAAPLDPAERRRLVATDLLFATVLRQASDAIVSTDADGSVRTWNAGAEQLFQVPEADAVGAPLAGLFDDAEGFAALLAGAVAGTGGRREWTVTVHGAAKAVEATVDGLRDDAGQAIGVVAILRDVTAQRHAENALQQASRQKDDFLAMLAHELRNPLAPIRSAAHILRALDVGTEPRVQRAADIILRQVRHLSSLVDDLLDVARVTRGAITLHTRPTELQSVLASAVEQTRALATDKHQALVVEVPDGLWVTADPDRLVQVFANLLHNAAKFTQDGGAVTVRARGGQGTVDVEVADDGVGIAVDLMPRLFDLFSQGERSSARSQGGLGIGLALAKTLVELHGGRIEAHSEGPGRGSRFTVQLPSAAAPAALPVGELAAERAAEKAGAAPRGGPPLRLMVVDDNADAAEALGDVLIGQGHQVLVQLDPGRALAKAPVFRADVYILDLGMPGMDGIELARRLRALPEARHAQLVALTGYGQPADRARTLAAGFDHHFVKPLDWPLLAGVLAQLRPAA